MNSLFFEAADFENLLPQDAADLVNNLVEKLRNSNPVFVKLLEENYRLADHNRELGISLDNLAHIEEENERLRAEVDRIRAERNTAEEALTAVQLVVVALEAEVEQASVVYCRLSDGKWACDEHPGFARTTHKARLVRVEEIKK